MESVNINKLSNHLAQKFELDSDDILESINEFIANSETEGLVLIGDYSEKSSALFGNTKSIWEKLKELNGDKKKVVTFNSKLAFGPGIVVTGKYLKEVKKCLKDEGVEFEEKKRVDYEKEFKGEPVKKTPAKKEVKKTPAKKESKNVTKKNDYSKMTVEELKAELEEKGLKKTGKKADLIERLESAGESTSDSEDPNVAKKASKTQAKGKKMPTSKTAPKLKAKKNEWGNFEDEETGVVFMKLAVGKDGKDKTVAIGVQNTEGEGQGLETVLPFDEDVVEECKKNKFEMLTEAMLKTLKKSDKDMYSKIRDWIASSAVEGGDEGCDDVEDEEE